MRGPFPSLERCGSGPGKVTYLGRLRSNLESKLSFNCGKSRSSCNSFIHFWGIPCAQAEYTKLLAEAEAARAKAEAAKETAAKVKARVEELALYRGNSRNYRVRLKARGEFTSV